MKFETEHVHLCWPPIAAALDGLERIEALGPNTVAKQRRWVDAHRAAQIEQIESHELDCAVEMCGRLESLRANEWLTQQYQRRVVPRKKPAPPTELQIRVERATNAKRILIEADKAANHYRVCIVTLLGDVVTCVGPKLQWTMDGALRMASSGVAT